MCGEISLPLAALIGLMLWPGADEVTATTHPPRKLNATEQTLVKADNSFGLNLFQQVLQGEKDRNVFISPLSVSMALSMTYNGADGITREAMARALQLRSMTLESINQANKSLIELLTGLDTAVQFTIANSIWYREEFRAEPAFLDLNKKYFNAEVAGLDFGNPGTPQVINRWVEKNTNGKISKIVGQIDPLTMMILINAIYFKGIWTDEFDKKKTHDSPFTLTDGTTQTCSMMFQDDSFPYYEDSVLQAIDLPYGSGHYSMTILLPRPEIDLDSFLVRLTARKWDKIMSGLAESEGEVYLPKFKLEYELSLNDALSALGMGIAFDAAKADFTGICKGGKLFISEVKHKTFVDVNEEGTEAAAVTSVVMALSAAMPAGFVMRVDRPFMFVIRDHHSGTLLFMGKIVEPVLE